MDIDECRAERQQSEQDLAVLLRRYHWWRARPTLPGAAVQMLLARHEYKKSWERHSLLPDYKPIKAIETLARGVIGRLIINVRGFFNVGGNISDSQIDELAAMVAEANKGLTLEDIAVCFHRAKKGEFGEAYRIDGQVIMVWLKKYREERQHRLESKAQARYLHKRSGISPTEERESKRVLEKTNIKTKKE